MKGWKSNRVRWSIGPRSRWLDDWISVVCFNNPVTALEHFIENKKDYALVISDLRMPNLNGLDLLHKIKMINSNVRTILVSAYEVKEDEVFQKYTKEGIIDLFIGKPIPIDWLRQKVREQIEAYEQRMNEWNWNI